MQYNSIKIPILISKEPRYKYVGIIGAIALTAFLSHGLYLSKLTFFWDEWNYLFLYLNKGAEGVIQAVGVRRASVAYLTAFLFDIFGLHPFIWHLFAIILFIGIGVLAVFLTLKLAPGRIFEATAIGILFVAFPENRFFPMGIVSSIIYLSYFSITLSLYLTVLAIQSPKRVLTYLYSSIAVCCAALVAVGYEIFWGFEALRFLLIYYFLSESPYCRNLIHRTLKALLWWLPYLIAIIPYLAWRIFSFQSSKDLADAGKHLGNIIEDPLSFFISATQNAYYSLVDCLAVVWGQIPLDVAGKSDFLSVLAGIALGLLAAIISLFILSKFANKDIIDQEFCRPYLSGILLGVVCLPTVGLLNDTTNLIKLALFLLFNLLIIILWIFNKYTQAQLKNGSNWIKIVAFWTRFYLGVCTAFFVFLPYRYQGLETNFVNKVIFISILGAALCIILSRANVLIYLKNVFPVQNKPPLRLNLFWWGIAVLLVGISVVLLAERSATIRGGARYIIPAILGSSIILGGTMFQILGNRVGSAFLAILVFAGVATGYINSRTYYIASKELNTLSWQLIWRVPNIKDHSTLVIKPFTRTRLASHSHISGLTAGLYSNPTLHGLILRDKHPKRGVKEILAQKKVGFWLGGELDPERVLIVAGPSKKRCLWLLNYPLLAFAPQEDRQLDLVQKFSNANLALPTRKSISPKGLIGAEPSKDCWCYFFEKADLAFQIKKWHEIVRLWGEARHLGLSPHDPRELVPFIKGFWMTGQRKEAKKLVKQAQKMASENFPAKELLSSALQKSGIPQAFN